MDWSSFVPYATGIEGIVEVESQWTARRREVGGASEQVSRFIVGTLEPEDRQSLLRIDTMQRAYLAAASRLLFALRNFFIHTVVASLVIPLFTGLLVVPLDNYTAIRQLLDKGGILNPSTWALGLVAGYAINRRAAYGRGGCWTWIGGVAWMSIGVAESLHFYHLLHQWYGTCSALDNIYNSFFVMDSSKCRGASEILDGIFFTFPSLNAVSYSIGACLGLWLRRPASVPTQ
jgi:hypothetical protein